MAPPVAKNPVEEEVVRPDIMIDVGSTSDVSLVSSGYKRAKMRRKIPVRASRRRVCADENMETLMLYDGEVAAGARVVQVASPPRDATTILSLPTMSWNKFLHSTVMSRNCVLSLPRR